MLPKVLRVSVFNNFNYTEKEFVQLDELAEKRIDLNIFVNSNSYNKITGNYPAIVTINPPIDRFIRPRGDINLIKAARIKYVSDGSPKVIRAFQDSLGWCLNNNIPVLITYMRFRKEETLKGLTMSKFNYVWAKNYFRQKIKRKWANPLINYCDPKEQGCPSCMNCARLTFGFEKADLYSINLSSSGICNANCPDCYVKTISQWHDGKICMDKIMQNTKQTGKKDFKIYKYGQKKLTFDNFIKWNETNINK